MGTKGRFVLESLLKCLQYFIVIVNEWWGNYTKYMIEHKVDSLEIEKMKKDSRNNRI